MPANYRHEKFQNKLLISLALPVYNDVAAMCETLKSLISEVHGLQEKVEILVSDNCSEDNADLAAEKILSTVEQKKVFKQTSNLGFAGNLKALALESSARYIWFIGAGDVLVPGTLKRILDVLEDENDWDFGTVMTLFLYHNHDLYQTPILELESASSQVESSVPVFSHAISSNIMKTEIFRSFDKCDGHENVLGQSHAGTVRKVSDLRTVECYWPHLEAVSIYARSHEKSGVRWFFFKPLTILLKSNKNGNWDKGESALLIFLQWVQVVEYAYKHLSNSLWLRKLSNDLRSSHLLAFLFMLRKERVLPRNALIKQLQNAKLSSLVKLSSKFIIFAPQSFLLVGALLRRFLPKAPRYHRS
jgi:glycosyltransferase involved in cell wall biosynthesis